MSRVNQLENEYRRIDSTADKLFAEFRRTGKRNISEEAEISKKIKELETDARMLDDTLDQSVYNLKKVIATNCSQFEKVARSGDGRAARSIASKIIDQSSQISQMIELGNKVEKLYERKLR